MSERRTARITGKTGAKRRIAGQARSHADPVKSKNYVLFHEIDLAYTLN
ncbi:hypothetical protein HU735_08815 [Pseudomonas sp. BW16M2]|nr:hypothetical protein [Pseudomonas sp. BW16M2]MBC3435514.1 hypothetical protein [Pseudomonas sp. BW16M2]